MTLVEVMIVLTITAGAMSFAAYSVVGYLSTGRVQEARAEVNQIEGFVDTYRVIHERLPKDLAALEREEAGLGPVVERVPQDPWGHPYEYRVEHDGTFVLFSLGPDGRIGTEDDIHPHGAIEARD